MAPSDAPEDTKSGSKTPVYMPDSTDSRADMHRGVTAQEPVSTTTDTMASLFAPDPLVSSKLGNLQPTLKPEDIPSSSKQMDCHSEINVSEMQKILANICPAPTQPTADPMPQHPNELLHRLSTQHLQSNAQNSRCDDASTETSASAGGFQVGSIFSDNHDSVAEMLRLRRELMAANTRIAQQEQELAETRNIKQTLDQALGSPSEADFGGRDVSDHVISNLQSALNTTSASVRPFNHRQEPWAGEDAQSDISDALSGGAYNRARVQAQWAPMVQAPLVPQRADRAYQDPMNMWSTPILSASLTPQGPAQPHRMFSGPSSGASSLDGRYMNEQNTQLGGSSFQPRRCVSNIGRGAPCFGPATGNWSPFGSVIPNGTASKPLNAALNAYQQIGMHPIPQYQARPIGTPLSPTAAEFTANSANGSAWIIPSAVERASPQPYLPGMEPLNYRRLLDKGITCDWKAIVSKIVHNNDQQASIFLQQKLKVGTAEQKYDIIEAIVDDAYKLMVNRFGNFLVQRCFEHGTPEQVVAIANAIKGNTVNLSMDPFGCHVVQKAFDCVPEEHKAGMVHELLRRIPETVIHRYACHVWQKLFELRWNGEPPQIMARVNEALRGMWHEVALGETGSLVVQNIFENCLEEEKRPAIEEVLAHIDLLSHGQFGNWCIQHICEHGAPRDKNRAIDHILRSAVDYSMDQFASKVVEKCLKIGGSEFLDRYLARVCTGRADRPRMPLIDIAGDQYGNYLIQWILTNASPHQRDLVASHIRKHMVSLRGSKFGSRVAMLCNNPSHAIRPGPGTNIGSRYGNSADERLATGHGPGNRYHRGGAWHPGYSGYR